MNTGLVGRELAAGLAATAVALCAAPAADLGVAAGAKFSAATSAIVLTVMPSAIVRDGHARIALNAPAGTARLRIVHHGRAIGVRSVTLSAAGPRTIPVALVSSARRELRNGNFSAGLRVTFVDVHGTRVVRRFGLRLKRDA